MTREEEIRARAEAELKNLQRSPLVMISGPRVEKVLGEDIPYMLAENARLRAELEAAKRDIRVMLQREQNCEFCSFCSQNTEHGDCTNDCEKAEWRGPCAKNGGTK
jgi:hypothetical protein